VPATLEDLKVGDTIIAMAIDGTTRIIGVVGVLDKLPPIGKDEKLYRLPASTMKPLSTLIVPPRFEREEPADLMNRFVGMTYERALSRSIMSPAPLCYIDLAADPTPEERAAEARAIAEAEERERMASQFRAVELLAAIVRVCVHAAATTLIEIDNGPRADAPDAAPDPFPLDLE
jgi:hypothetical protein